SGGAPSASGGKVPSGSSKGSDDDTTPSGRGPATGSDDATRPHDDAVSAAMAIQDRQAVRAASAAPPCTEGSTNARRAPRSGQALVISRVNVAGSCPRINDPALAGTMSIGPL